MGARGSGKTRIISQQGIVPPYPLSKQAQAIWNVIVPKLKKAGMLEDIDVFLVVTYCNAIALMREAMEMVKSQGPVIESLSRYGEIRKKNPWCNVWSESYKQSASAGRAMGIGFVARSHAKLGIPLGDDEDEGGALEKALFGSKKAPRASSGDDDE